MAEPVTVPLSAIAAAGCGRLYPHADGILLVTGPERWSFAAQAGFALAGPREAPRLVTIATQVETGVLGVGWWGPDGSGWVARKSSGPTDGTIDLRLLLPAGTQGGNLVFDNWCAGETRAVIAGVRVAEIALQPAGLGIDLTTVETQAAVTLAGDPEGPVRCCPVLRDDCPEPFRTYRARDALVIGQPGVFGIRRGNRLLCLRESANNTYLLPSLLDQAVERISAPAPSSMTLRSASLLNGYSAHNIWHWFMEWAVKVVPLEESGFAGAYLVPDMSPVQARSLELMGIARHRLVPHATDCVIVDELAFTQHTMGQSVFWHYPWILRALRERIGERVGAQPGLRRLYVARRGTRRVANEAAIVPILEAYGFHTVYMEDHPIDTQIAMAQGADIIAGPHGAGLVFAAFMRSGGVLIEMFSSDFVDPCMLGVCHALELFYFMLTSRKKPAGTYVSEEIEVDLPMLRLTLENAARLAAA